MRPFGFFSHFVCFNANFCVMFPYHAEKTSKVSDFFKPFLYLFKPFLIFFNVVAQRFLTRLM